MCIRDRSWHDSVSSSRISWHDSASWRLLYYRLITDDWRYAHLWVNDELWFVLQVSKHQFWTCNTMSFEKRKPLFIMGRTISYFCIVWRRFFCNWRVLNMRVWWAFVLVFEFRTTLKPSTPLTATAGAHDWKKFEHSNSCIYACKTQFFGACATEGRLWLTGPLSIAQKYLPNLNVCSCQSDVCPRLE